MTTPPEPDQGRALSTDELLSGVDATWLPETWSPGDLSRMSVNAFVRQRIVPQLYRAEGTLRLSGPAIIDHAAPIAETSRLLGSLQKAVTYVSASVQQGTTRPSITASIRERTTLLLTPNLAPGSLEISVIGREPVRSEPALIPTQTELDSGMRELLSLFEDAGVGEDGHGLTERLRALGPRTARTLLKLTDTVLTDDVRLDLRWRTSDDADLRGSLGRPQASAISAAIQEGRIQVDQVTLVGWLRTISQIPNVPLDLILDNGQRAQIRANDEQRAGLGPLYDTRVTVVADESVQTSAKGEGRRQLDLVSVRSFEVGDASTMTDDDGSD